MTRNQSLVIFAFTFALDSVMNFLKEPTTVVKGFGATTVFLGGVAEARTHSPACHNYRDLGTYCLGEKKAIAGELREECDATTNCVRNPWNVVRPRY